MPQIDRNSGLVGNAAIKVPVRAASTGNVAALNGEQTIDGIALLTGDRVLLKDQTDAVDNGIWVVDTGDWNRAQDFDGVYDIVQGTIVMVVHGTTNSNTYFRVSTEDPVIDETDIDFLPALGSDAALLTFLQAGTGAVTQTMEGKVRQEISTQDFGMSEFASGAANLIAFQNAINYVQSIGGELVGAPVQYDIAGTATGSMKFSLRGRGKGETSGGFRLRQTSAGHTLVIAPTVGGVAPKISNVAFKSIVNGTGDLLRITRGPTGITSNGGTIEDCYFNLPQRACIHLAAGDDWQVQGCTFDVVDFASAGADACGLRLGDTASALDKVLNTRLIGNNAYYCGVRPFHFLNVEGVLAVGNSMYWDAAASSYSNYFFDMVTQFGGVDPLLLKNVVIVGGTAEYVVSLVGAKGCNNLTVMGLTGTNIGGNGITNHVFPITGACSGNIILQGNNVTQIANNKNVFDDSAATGTYRLNITGETYTSVGGTGIPMNAIGTGTVANNEYPGYTAPYLGGRYITSGGTFNPGTLAGGASIAIGIVALKVRAGDQMNIGLSSGSSWPLPQGIVTRCFCAPSSSGSAVVDYMNVTTSPSTIINHDWSVRTWR